MVFGGDGVGEDREFLPGVDLIEVGFCCGCGELAEASVEVLFEGSAASMAGEMVKFLRSVNSAL